jgi:predicted Zn-dependent protease
MVAKKSFGLLVASASLVVASLAACVTNPATGEREFVPFMPSKDQQVTLGLQSAPQFVQQGGGKFANESVQTYVQSVGQRVLNAAPAADKQGYQFSYTLTNDTAVNAFALPGGPIFITKGLLFRLENEAQLAFVLGHETGHVIAQHVARQTSKQTELQVAMEAANMAAGGNNASTAGQVGMELGQYAGSMYLLKFSRDEESQADTLGLKYLVAAGYDPSASVGVMKILQTASGGTGKENDWFETHPATGNRIAQLNDLIQKNYPQALNNSAYVLNPQPFQKAVLSQPH